MKKLTLTICTLALAGSAAFAGTSTYSSSKNMTSSPCPSWYADNEWNVGISAVYAPTANDAREDEFLGTDHGWGAGLDIKYFFRRYFGIGVQGFGLHLTGNDDNDFFRTSDFAGGVLGTFTFRYPIPCTRFAPYAWAGVGGIWTERDNNNSPTTRIAPIFPADNVLMGQYGIGIEYRFSQHFGLTTDVSYNNLEYSHNDFWQMRAGLNFAF